MVATPITQCDVCRHFLGGLDKPRPTCEAYPGGIPTAIRTGQVDHRRPQPGDHGIQWASDGPPYPVSMLTLEPVVEAVRDDGAIMVTAGEAGAVVLADGQAFYLPKNSLYARGDWEPAPAGMAVPDSIDLVRLAAAQPGTVAGHEG